MKYFLLFFAAVLLMTPSIHASVPLRYSYTSRTKADRAEQRERDRLHKQNQRLPKSPYEKSKKQKVKNRKENN